MKNSVLELAALTAALCCVSMLTHARAQDLGTDELEGGELGHAQRPWSGVFDWLRGEQERMGVDLEAAHGRLRELCEQASRTELLAQLSPTPPRPRATGYRLLPELGPDHLVDPIRIRENRYSLESISTKYTVDMRDGAMLRARLEAGGAVDLDAAVLELQRLRGRFENLGAHLDYHLYWQQAVVEQAGYFAGRNAIASDVRKLRDLEQADPAGPSAELRESVRARVAPFERTPGLELRSLADGSLALDVAVVTDIEDESFLAAFEHAVREVYDQSEAFLARRLRIRLTLQRVAPAELYPEALPAPGADLVEHDHLARFPEGALVLTTGAAQTHAFVGRAILLGTAPMNERGLAHEFGHLLGFSDAYLRAYDGDPNGPFGVVVVEFVGLLDDLMGDLRRPVSAAMAERLIRSYWTGAADPAEQ